MSKSLRWMIVSYKCTTRQLPIEVWGIFPPPTFNLETNRPPNLMTHGTLIKPLQNLYVNCFTGRLLPTKLRFQPNHNTLGLSTFKAKESLLCWSKTSALINLEHQVWAKRRAIRNNHLGCNSNINQISYDRLATMSHTVMFKIRTMTDIQCKLKI